MLYSCRPASQSLTKSHQVCEEPGPKQYRAPPHVDVGHRSIGSYLGSIGSFSLVLLTATASSGSSGFGVNGVSRFGAQRKYLGLVLTQPLTLTLTEILATLDSNPAKESIKVNQRGRGQTLDRRVVAQLS